MAFVFMTDEATGRCALFEENGTIGDPQDPNSVRNAPLNNPELYLDKIRFHSDFDYYTVLLGPTTVSITHPLAAGRISYPFFFPDTGFGIAGQVVTSEQTLITHNLGYIPSYMIISDGAIIAPSTIINSTASATRYVTPFVTNNIIGLNTTAVTDQNDLPAITKNYTVIVFRKPQEENSYLIDFNPENGEISMGRGKFKGNYKNLRVAASGDMQPFDISLGRTVDIRNGGIRTVLADGIIRNDPYYVGSFAGSEKIDGTIE